MARPLFNPFPGLRPFEPDEDHLFFGREDEIDELLRRLRTTRFLAVVGTSGSGKSSLVRSGLIPSLQSGYMVTAGSSWRIAMFRPGEDPVGHLAGALDARDVLGVEGELASTNRVLIEATLGRGARGLVDVVRQARIPAADNVLVVVDQFEELFRFRRSRHIENSRDEAIAFVKLLLEAAHQTDVPIYVVLTMRSDFIGDCMEYPGLAEAVNDGTYLVPRMSRDDLRSAITGPVAVGGGAIAPRLVLRVLNDLGDDQDQLPVLQHALMRTWDHWERGDRAQPIDVGDYEAIGTLAGALSRHAEEAYVETGSDERRRITERMFKALTDTVTDHRGVRRPTSVADLALICEAGEAEVIAIVDIFRRPGRSFLMPPPRVPLTSRSIIDLSHESLMRCWTRLIAWAEEERASAAFYVRLSQAAAWFAEGTAGLWRDPELELGLRWKRKNHPTRAWAERYDPGFERAIAFLDRSEQEWTRLKAEREREQKRQLRRARAAAGVLAALLAVVGGSLYLALKENRRAEANLGLAKTAVDETLASVEVDPAKLGADVPQITEVRRVLIRKAETFYKAFIQQKPDREELYYENALAHFRLGHINRLLGRQEDAVREYRDAIAQLQPLVRAHPANTGYKESLANAYNWLGEALRLGSGGPEDAEAAYNDALALQKDTGGAPLARTYYNRGILRGASASVGDEKFQQADDDFREAIRLLEPIVERHADRVAAQDLGRAYNNLASLIALDDSRLAEARSLYERAIGVHERLAREDPDNREYRVELAKFYNNVADVLRQQHEPDGAKARSQQAIDLLDDLARPAPSLGIERADAHNLRALILAERQPDAALAEYERAVDDFERLARDPYASRLAEFHLRFGELLLNLSDLTDRGAKLGRGRALLARAVGGYLARTAAAFDAGSVADAPAALENVAQLLPELPEPERSRITKSYEALRDRVAAKK